jgi:hypothetical protein
VIRLPPMSPNLNAYAERFVRSIKDECLDRMIFVGQGSLRRAVAEYMTHYHAERNHQGLDNPCASPWNIELLLPRGGMMQSFENLDVRDREQDQRCFGAAASACAIAEASTFAEVFGLIFQYRNMRLASEQSARHPCPGWRPP